MKNLFRFAVVCLSASAFATNGDHFIGVSPAGTAMGGTGVANFTNSTDALHKNPALLAAPNLGKNVNGEASFLFIKNNASANAGAGLKSSTAGGKIAPNLAASYSYNDDLAVGVGLLAFGGAVVDQVGNLELSQLQTRLSLLKVVPAVSYRLSELVTVSLAPQLFYGSLSVNHGTATGAQTSRAPHGAAGLGGQLGAAFYPTKGLTLGLTYQVEANLTYKDIMDLDAFGPNGGDGIDDIQTQQPAEFALGAGYQILDDLTVTADYRLISWNTAKAFRELGWQNQNVIAVGAQYRAAAWKFRAGFNHGTSPIQDTTGEAGLTPVNFQGHSVFQQSLTTLNLIAFPAVVENHLTFGAGYDVDPDLHLDLNVVLGLKKSITRAGTGLNPLVATPTPGAYSYTGEASQFSVSLGAVYSL